MQTKEEVTYRNWATTKKVRLVNKNENMELLHKIFMLKYLQLYYKILDYVIGFCEQKNRKKKEK